MITYTFYKIIDAPKFCFAFVKVMVCSSMETSQRFVLKQVDGEDNAFAVRKVGLCQVDISLYLFMVKCPRHSRH